MQSELLGHYHHNHDNMLSVYRPGWIEANWFRAQKLFKTAYFFGIYGKRLDEFFSNLNHVSRIAFLIDVPNLTSIRCELWAVCRTQKHTNRFSKFPTCQHIWRREASPNNEVTTNLLISFIINVIWMHLDSKMGLQVCFVPNNYEIILWFGPDQELSNEMGEIFSTIICMG